MLKKIGAAALTLTMAQTAYADVPITGTVESKCSIFTTRAGVYGTPTADTLSTDPSDGGVDPIVRVDVATGGAYRLEVTPPTTFTSSPSLNEQLTWTNDVNVDQVSDVNMANYDTNKATYGSTHEYDLTEAGSTWFKIESKVEYGVDKPLPSGRYTAQVAVMCMAN